jgi:cytochrome oxidase Cu insertion factor (SCO1/SenC/PrrC family)
MKNKFVIIILSILLVSPGCLSSEDTDIFYGDDINPPIPAEDFILIDGDGEYYQLSQLEGKVIVIAFLFTRCPDVCPIVSANLDFISEQLGDIYEEEVVILTITVDPWTDNTSVMNDYAGARNLEWPHLTGTVEDLEPVWKNFDVGLQTYDSDIDGDGVADGFDVCAETPEGEEVDGDGCGIDTQQTEEGDVQVNHHPLLSYWVDHTTGTIIVDKNMNQRVWWEDTLWNPDLVMEDILLLVEE